MCLCCGLSSTDSRSKVVGELIKNESTYGLNLTQSTEGELPVAGFMGCFSYQFEKWINGVFEGFFELNGTFDNLIVQNNGFDNFGIEVLENSKFNHFNFKYSGNYDLKIIVKYSSDCTVDSGGKLFLVNATLRPQAIWTETNL